MPVTRRSTSLHRLIGMDALRPEGDRRGGTNRIGFLRRSPVQRIGRVPTRAFSGLSRSLCCRRSRIQDTARPKTPKHTWRCATRNTNQIHLTGCHVSCHAHSNPRNPTAGIFPASQRCRLGRFPGKDSNFRLCPSRPPQSSIELGCAGVVIRCARCVAPGPRQGYLNLDCPE